MVFGSPTLSFFSVVPTQYPNFLKCFVALQFFAVKKVSLHDSFHPTTTF